MAGVARRQTVAKRVTRQNTPHNFQSLIGLDDSRNRCGIVMNACGKAISEYCQIDSTRKMFTRSERM